MRIAGIKVWVLTGDKQVSWCVAESVCGDTYISDLESLRMLQ